MASSRTKVAYGRVGERLLRRAERMHGELSPLDALLEEAKGPGILLATTVRRYRPSYLAALSVVLDGQPPLVLNAHYDRVCAVLDDRRGKPDKDRTSSQKKDLPTKSEAEAIFRLLKARALENRNLETAAAALYVLVVPRIAVRPIELLTIEVDEWEMLIRNAKRKSGQGRFRRISLSRFSPSFIAAAKLLALLARKGVQDRLSRAGTEFRSQLTEDEAFELWRNAVAEALARASEDVCKRRLSLYAFRHLGIATWKASGFSAPEIAAMAGHLSLKTAWRYYAPASAGWSNEKLLAAPVALPAYDEDGDQITASSVPGAATADVETGGGEITEQRTQTVGDQEQPVLSQSSQSLEPRINDIDGVEYPRPQVPDPGPTFDWRDHQRIQDRKLADLDDVVDRLRQRNGPAGFGPPRKKMTDLP